MIILICKIDYYYDFQNILITFSNKQTNRIVFGNIYTILTEKTQKIVNFFKNFANYLIYLMK